MTSRLAARQSPSSVRQTSPSRNPAAGPPEGPPLLAPPPKSLLPPRPPLRSRRGRVSQPCLRLVCGRGRAVSPVIRTARPGECWALNDSTALNRPRPVQQPTSATRHFHVRDERPERPTAVEGPVAERSEAVHPGGPAGISSVGDQLRPPSAWCGAETTENDGRLKSSVVIVRQLCQLVQLQRLCRQLPGNT